MVVPVHLGILILNREKPYSQSALEILYISWKFNPNILKEKQMERYSTDLKKQWFYVTLHTHKESVFPFTLNYVFKFSLKIHKRSFEVITAKNHNSSRPDFSVSGPTFNTKRSLMHGWNIQISKAQISLWRRGHTGSRVFANLWERVQNLRY